MSSQTQDVKLAEIFRFLAQSMKYPEPKWFNDSYWSVLDSLLDDLVWSEEREILSTWGRDTGCFLEKLQLEYTRLFINAVPHVLAPPYASVYAHDDGTLYGQITEQTKKFYKEKGYALNSEDIPDHIVYELEFLAILVVQDKYGFEVFLTTLFYPWFTKFQKKVLKETNNAFFEIIIKLIDFFTRKEG